MKSRAAHASKRNHPRPPKRKSSPAARAAVQGMPVPGSFSDGLLAQVCHEIRVPLSLILGYVETLQSGMIRKGRSFRKCLEVMEKHGSRMMRMIDDILVLSALDRRSGRLRRERFHVRACLADVLAHLAPEIERRQAIVEIDLPEHGGTIAGDRFAWDQALTNLIEHSLQAADQCRPHIRVKGGWMQDGFALEITRNGPSIAEADLASLFNPFHRDGSGQAAGLGLCIAKRAIEARGGTLTASSKAGRGARFLIHVPAALANRSAAKLW